MNTRTIIREREKARVNGKIKYKNKIELKRRDKTVSEWGHKTPQQKEKDLKRKDKYRNQLGKQLFQKMWEPEEIQYLIDNYENQTTLEMATYLNRSYGSVESKIVNLRKEGFDENIDMLRKSKTEGKQWLYNLENIMMNFIKVDIGKSLL